MTVTDPIQAFKDKQREGWASFAPIETMTTPCAARLVRFAGVRAGQEVLDVACGTGVVALTARREGARVTGLDLTPELLARAKVNSVSGYEDVVWKEGDAEVLPFGDAKFDVVLSQFGHMFAPRADRTLSEMLRVLRPGGTIAFSTWPPELFTGQLFQIAGRHAPPLPPGASPSPQWGDIGIVRQRLGEAVRDIEFDRDVMRFAAISPAHYRASIEEGSAPVRAAVRAYANEPAKLAAYRKEIDTLIHRYFEPAENVVRMDYLMTRAIKR